MIAARTTSRGGDKDIRLTNPGRSADLPLTTVAHDRRCADTSGCSLNDPGEILCDPVVPWTCRDFDQLPIFKLEALAALRKVMEVQDGKGPNPTSQATPQPLMISPIRPHVLIAVDQLQSPSVKALTKLGNLCWRQSMRFECLVRHATSGQQRLGEHRLIEPRIRFPRLAQ